MAGTITSHQDPPTIIAEAWSRGKHSERFFEVNTWATRASWTRLRSGMPGRSIYSLAGIAANGTIVGTVSKGHGSVFLDGRAVMWLPRAGRGYGRAVMLPLGSREYRKSSAEAVWSAKGRTIVAGCSFWVPTANCLTLWTLSATGGVRIWRSDSGAYASIASVGGWGRHMFAGGVTGGDGGLPLPWAATVRFSSGRGMLSHVHVLHFPHGGTGQCTSVSAGPAGSLVAIGSRDVLSPPMGVMWRGRTVQALQRLLPPSNPAMPDFPVGINAKGEIIGTAMSGGERFGFVLRSGSG